MIRIEMLEERNGAYYASGLYQLLPESYFIMTNLDHGPRLENPYTLSFPQWKGGKQTFTHIGFFPAIEYTGIVSPLTNPLTVKNGEYVSFRAGHITISMLMDEPPITAIKERT